MAQNGLALEYANDTLKNDKEVVLTAVRSKGYALKWASDALRADREVVLAAVAQNVGALEWASYAFGADREVVLAVAQDGERRRWGGPAGCSRLIEVVLAAVAQSGYALGMEVMCFEMTKK